MMVYIILRLSKYYNLKTGKTSYVKKYNTYERMLGTVCYTAPIWIEQEEKLIIHHCLDKRMTASSQQIMTLVTQVVVYFNVFDRSLMFEHFSSATERNSC